MTPSNHLRATILHQLAEDAADCLRAAALQEWLIAASINDVDSGLTQVRRHLMTARLAVDVALDVVDPVEGDVDTDIAKSVADLATLVGGVQMACGFLYDYVDLGDAQSPMIATAILDEIAWYLQEAASDDGIK
jgi:hypothetical protein